MCEDDGILGSDGIELLAIGESFLRPKSVIPATAGDPFACFVLRNGGGNALLHFFRGKPARQRDGKFVGGGATEMDVRIVEAGHHKLAFELDRLHAFLAASAIEEDVVHFADATDLSVADRHGLGPGLRRIVCVNAAVSVIGRVRSFLCHAGFRVECCKEGDDNKRENACKESSAILWDSHRDLSSATPETPRTVRSARFNPVSRPAESYHSWRECAPPPLPPAPMEMASIPRDSGIFASVEERSMRD